MSETRMETVAGLSSAGTKKMNSDELRGAEQGLLKSAWRTGKRLCGSISSTVHGTCFLLMKDSKRRTTA